MPKDQLVYVEWEDSYGCSPRWQEIAADVQPRVLICRSVGWIIRRTKRCIVIVPHMTTGDVAEPQACGDMTIPTAAIVKIAPLELGSARKRL